MEIALNNYELLLSQVQKAIQKTEQNIVRSVNREKVVMSWELGKIIDQHLVKNDRADYGKKLFSQLAQDTSIAERTLYQMRTFYKTYPTLPSEKASLSWSHYRNLISVGSDTKRKYLEDLTVKKNLDSTQLQKKISQSHATAKPKKSVKFSVTRGQLYAYKLVTFSDSSECFADCGFNVFTKVKTSLKGQGQIVESLKKGEGFGLKKSTKKPAEIHTYKATLDRVVDGDTIHVTLDLGFEIRHKEILRLAKINAPEMATAAGKKSAETLQNILKDVPVLVIKTNKTDIYGRYIADVFFSETGETDLQKIADAGSYLNQMLFDLGVVEEY